MSNVREIKFRAWVPAYTKDQKPMMIEGVQPLFADPLVPSKDGKPFCMAPYDLNFIQNSPRGAQGKRYWVEMEVDAIMQFTGLRDKNGKEIYESDIIKFDDKNIGFIDCHEWTEFFVNWIGDPDCTDYARDFYRISNAEIIGNVHENPELL